MKQFYTVAGALFFGICAINHVHGQAHFGPGVGMQGENHSFFGKDAGKINTGHSNTFLGSEAGKSNTTGQENTFVGHQSGLKTTIGKGNIFLGESAGRDNTKGNFNTFIGLGTGAKNTTGGYNVFVGVISGAENLDGFSNTFVGEQSGNLNVSGSNNSFLGRGSGYYNDVGNNNVYLGFDSGFFSTSGSSNVFIGSASGRYNKIGGANAFLGTESGYSNTTGSNNAFFGYGSGYTNTKGEKNTYLGYAAGGNPEITNATAIGALSKVTASNSLVLGNNANVGIGLTAPAYQLHLSTDAAAKLGTPTWTVASDRRLKKDISDYTDGLEMLKKIHPVWFRYNGEAGTKTGKKFVGVIAQEMKEIAPYTVGNFTYQDSLGNKTEYLDYDAGAVTYMLINAVKEQQEIIEQKEVKIQDLAKRLEQLERIVAAGTMKPLTGNSATRQETNANGVTIGQNAPNGFSQSTTIHFFIPQLVKDAVINVYSVAGVKVGSYPVKERGDGSLTLSANQFENGTFVYDLVTDGKSNGAKKMIVAK